MMLRAKLAEGSGAVPIETYVRKREYVQQPFMSSMFLENMRTNRQTSTGMLNLHTAKSIEQSPVK